MPPKKTVSKPAAKPVSKAVASKAPSGKTVAKKPVGKTNQPVAGKKPAASTSKSSQPTKQSKPAEKKWTAQDDAARKIQTEVRKFLAKKKLSKKKKEKEDYEAMMDKLEQEAFVKLVKMEQEQAEIQRQKEEAERRRKKEAIKRKKRMLEAAFDGDMDEINTVLKEAKQQDDKDDIGHDIVGEAKRNKHQMDLIECEDANANTPLSEGSSGGNVDVITFLIEKGADPNTKGHFGRTPLYRAAFAGHLEAVQMLLQYGADPRGYADDGQMPENVASHPTIVQTLTSWDLGQTEKLLAKIDADKEMRKEEDRKKKKVPTATLR